MFTKTGAIFTISKANRIKTAESWDDYLEAQGKTSAVEGVIIHRRKNPDNVQKVVCDIDLDKYIYIHTTIMASIDIEPGTKFYITKETEKYINNNGDAWPRDQLLKDYPTFVDFGSVFVEHDQNPERAKGKILDAAARDMGDTVLIDLLFCVDRRHEDLVNNIETGIANAVSMGCSTKYTICNICGNVAHDDSEYCEHIKRRKNQMCKCSDGKYRKAAELCFGNTFFDCSIVANPAFAGAVFRKLVASSQVSNQLLSNIINKKVDTMQYDDRLAKVASELTKTAVHPIEHGEDIIHPIEDPYADIPYRDPHNILKEFEEQQPKDQKVDIGKAKRASSGQLVVLTKRHNIAPEHRKVNNLFNFIDKDTVGRLIGKKGNKCAVYFSKIGMVKDIPAPIVRVYSVEEDKIPKTASDDDLSVNRRGMFKPFGDKFQILKIMDKDVEIRWLSGENAGEKQTLAKKEFKKSTIKWASTKQLASFDATWQGSKYQVKKAFWNEKHADLLDKIESHIDNIQHDITEVVPSSKGRYGKSFNINSKIGNTSLLFKTAISGDSLKLKIDSTEW